MYVISRVRVRRMKKQNTLTVHYLNVQDVTTPHPPTPICVIERASKSKTLFRLEKYAN